MAKNTHQTATIGFEAKLWLTADKLRNNMDAAEYNGGRPQGLLGLIFLKYISDTFEEHRAKLLAGKGDYAGANAEDPDTAMSASARHSLRRSRIPQDFCGAKDQYKAENVFWVPAFGPTVAQSQLRWLVSFSENWDLKHRRQKREQIG